MRDARVFVDTLRLATPDDVGALSAAWADTDAPALVRLAQFEGVSLWLQRRLKALGIMLNGEAADTLAAAARRATAHSLRMDSETFATLAILDEAEIRAVPLKGAAMRRISSRVPYANTRAPNDVDILVQDDHAQRAWEALTARGYTPPKELGPPDGHHLPALVGPLGVGVEIHLTTSASVTPAEAWRRATSDGAAAGANGVPSDTELFWHAIAHAVAHAEEYGRVGTKLRYWLDPAALLAANASIDWARVRARLETRECADPRLVRAWIRTAADLSGQALPADALGHRGPAIDVVRMLSWRLRVFARYEPSHRWAERLIEEGARGETRLRHEPAHHAAASFARVRHAVAARAARLWWSVRRG
ncbi:MAG: nucleotidyltransferase family protein [Gemmatimonadaceae bacterium]